MVHYLFYMNIVQILIMISMDNPWDLKVSSERSSETIFVFHLFCEDKNSEPLYFEQFDGNGVKIICHREQKSIFRNYVKTIKKCVEDGFLKKQKGEYKIVNEGIEIWCVFDRDKGAQGEDVEEGNIGFDHVINNSLPINIAWSNDAFELWILLHLMEIEPNDYENARDRNFYYEKLKFYFENHQNPNIDLQKALKHPFGYKHSLKSEQNFKNIVLPEISGKVAIAIERAKTLFKIHEAEQDYSKKAPCTNVFQLVERILEKKKIN